MASSQALSTSFQGLLQQDRKHSETSKYSELCNNSDEIGNYCEEWDYSGTSPMFRNSNNSELRNGCEVRNYYEDRNFFTDGGPYKKEVHAEKKLFIKLIDSGNVL